jgi:putative effector of murein hydrolase
LFVLLIVTELIIPGLGDAAFYALAPGSGLLAKWLPVFFVPGLAMLPLAPSMGSSIEVVKVLAVVILGFFFTASTTSFSVLALRKMQGASNAPPRPTTFEISEGSVAQPPPKPYSDEFFSGLVKGLVLSGALSIGITKTLAAAAAEDAKNTFLTSISTPLQAVFLGFATVTGYVWGALLPSSFTKIVHPLVTSTVVTLVIASITGIITGSSFTNILSTYKTGSLHPLSTGAGDVLLYLLGPSVVSFAIAMYSRKKVMVDNLLVVVSAVLVASIGGLFGTAAFVKLLQVGGVGEAGRVLRISLLPRNVTTPLAIAITNILGGDISFAAAVVVLTGIFGATFGARILSSMGVHDPVSRGLGIGAAAQGLGVASLSGEKEAFPFAAIAMVLTAVVATVLVSIPVVKDNLLNMCM